MYLTKSMCSSIRTTSSNDIRQDVITLQNPHGFPQSSIPSAPTSSQSVTSKAATSKSAVSKPIPGGVTAVKSKAAVPCKAYPSHMYVSFYLHIGTGNVSPYSSGMPGASLTSTSVDPQTASSKLLWDEVRVTVAMLHILITIGSIFSGGIDV